jgi:hypothetical protein
MNVKPLRTGTDYPAGDGVPDCKQCKGRGVVPVIIQNQPGLDVTQPCECIQARDVRRNVDRGWPDLMTVTSEPPSKSLKTGLQQNLWITADLQDFRAQFKYIAVRQGPKWSFLVRTDADLMSAWLSNIDTQDLIDGEIMEKRGRESSERRVDLELLVVPPDLLVLNLGVKYARNSAMPEVFMEALLLRQYRNKPTWVVDSEHSPFAGPSGGMDAFGKPDRGHISWSQRAADFLSQWRHVKLTESKEEPAPKPQPRPVASAPAFDLPVLDATLKPSVEKVTVAPEAYRAGTASILNMDEDDAPEDPRKRFRKRKP